MQDQTEIHKKSISRNAQDRRHAVNLLAANFSDFPDKDQAWQDLITLINIDDSEVQLSASIALGSAFNHVPNKAKAWQDLVRLTKQSRWRSYVAHALEPAFSQVPNKAQAWQDLLKLIRDDLIRVDYNHVGWQVANALGSAFSHVSNKKQALQDLHKLANDKDSVLRQSAAKALGLVFSHIHDRELEQAWQDLHILTQDKDDSVRGNAAEALGNIMRIVPDRERELAWQDLHRLARDEGSHTRYVIAYAIAKAFSHIPDKAQAWQDILRLTEDEDEFVVLEVERVLRDALRPEDRIQPAIDNIHRKAELISPEINGAARSLSLDYPIKTYRCCLEMASALRDFSKRLSENQGKKICGILKDIEKEGDLFSLLNKIDQAMEIAHAAIEEERKKILDQLENIRSSLFNQSVSSFSDFACIDRDELDKNIKNFQKRMAAQELNMKDLGKLRDDWLKSIETMAQYHLSPEISEAILDEVQALKRSPGRDTLGILGDISSIAGLIIGLIGLAFSL